MEDQFNDYKDCVILEMVKIDAHLTSRDWLFKRLLGRFPLRQADIVQQLEDVDKCIDFIKQRATKRGWPVICGGNERILKARYIRCGCGSAVTTDVAEHDVVHGRLGQREVPAGDREPCSRLWRWYSAYPAGVTTA